MSTAAAPRPAARTPQAKSRPAKGRKRQVALATSAAPPPRRIERHRLAPEIEYIDQVGPAVEALRRHAQKVAQELGPEDVLQIEMHLVGRHAAIDDPWQGAPGVGVYQYVGSPGPNHGSVTEVMSPIEVLAEAIVLKRNEQAIRRRYEQPSFQHGEAGMLLCEKIAEILAEHGEAAGLLINPASDGMACLMADVAPEGDGRFSVNVRITAGGSIDPYAEASAPLQRAHHASTGGDR